MKKNIGLLSIFIGVMGIVLFFVASSSGIAGLPIVGLLLLVAGIVGGIVDGSINRLPSRVRHNEDTPGTRLDKGQLSSGAYTHDTSGSRFD